MIVAIIALIIGILVAGAGIYYVTKEKEDAESRKIYTISIESPGNALFISVSGVFLCLVVIFW